MDLSASVQVYGMESSYSTLQTVKPDKKSLAITINRKNISTWRDMLCSSKKSENTCLMTLLKGPDLPIEAVRY